MLRCLQIPVPDNVTDDAASQFLVNPGKPQSAHTFNASTHLL